MQIDLTDKVALVTGSAHRVGKAIALALADAGVNIMVHYHNSDENTVRDTLHDIKSLGVDAFSVQADISQPEGVQTVMAAVREHFDHLDILVNSASVFPSGDLREISVDSWNLTMNVNLRAPFLFTQQAAEIMQENDPPGGAIINIVDQGVDGPWKKRPHHGISKAALWSLTQVSAVTLAPDIRVNAVLPGPVMKTAGTMTDEEWEQAGQRTALQVTGEGSDVGSAVVYLVSQSFLTGVLLHVNGGEHLMRPE